MTSYKLSTIIVTSLWTQKISSSYKQEPAQQTPSYTHNNRKTVTPPKVLTPIIGPQCTINNSTTVPVTNRDALLKQNTNNDYYDFVPEQYNQKNKSAKD